MQSLLKIKNSGDMFQEHLETFVFFAFFLCVLCGKKINRKERKVLRKVRQVLLVFAMLTEFDIGTLFYRREVLFIYYIPDFL